jgi:hypothetical protein
MLLSLPFELILLVLRFLGLPRYLSSIGRVSKYLHSLVFDNVELWKFIYVRLFHPLFLPPNIHLPIEIPLSLHSTNDGDNWMYRVRKEMKFVSNAKRMRLWNIHWKVGLYPSMTWTGVISGVLDSKHFTHNCVSVQNRVLIVFRGVEENVNDGRQAFFCFLFRTLPREKYPHTFTSSAQQMLKQCKSSPRIFSIFKRGGRKSPSLTTLEDDLELPPPTHVHQNIHNNVHKDARMSSPSNFNATYNHKKEIDVSPRFLKCSPQITNHSPRIRLTRNTSQSDLHNIELNPQLPQNNSFCSAPNSLKPNPEQLQYRVLQKTIGDRNISLTLKQDDEYIVEELPTNTRSKINASPLSKSNVNQFHLKTNSRSPTSLSPNNFTQNSNLFLSNPLPVLQAPPSLTYEEACGRGSEVPNLFKMFRILSNSNSITSFLSLFNGTYVICIDLNTNCLQVWDGEEDRDCIHTETLPDIICPFNSELINFDSEWLCCGSNQNMSFYLLQINLLPNTHESLVMLINRHGNTIDKVELAFPFLIVFFNGYTTVGVYNVLDQEEILWYSFGFRVWYQPIHKDMVKHCGLVLAAIPEGSSLQVWHLQYVTESKARWEMRFVSQTHSLPSGLNWNGSFRVSESSLHYGGWQMVVKCTEMHSRTIHFHSVIPRLTEQLNTIDETIDFGHDEEEDMILIPKEQTQESSGEGRLIDVNMTAGWLLVIPTILVSAYLDNGKLYIAIFDEISLSSLSAGTPIFSWHYRNKIRICANFPCNTLEGMTFTRVGYCLVLTTPNSVHFLSIRSNGKVEKNGSTLAPITHTIRSAHQLPHYPRFLDANRFVSLTMFAHDAMDIDQDLLLNFVSHFNNLAESQSALLGCIAQIEIPLPNSAPWVSAVSSSSVLIIPYSPLSASSIEVAITTLSMILQLHSSQTTTPHKILLQLLPSEILKSYQTQIKQNEKDLRRRLHEIYHPHVPSVLFTDITSGKEMKKASNLLYSTIKTVIKERQEKLTRELKYTIKPSFEKIITEGVKYSDLKM